MITNKRLVSKFSIVILMIVFIALTVTGVVGIFKGNASQTDSEILLNKYYINGSTAAKASYGTVEQGHSGLIATLFPKDELVIQEIIDLNTTSPDDKLISVTPIPETLGVAEFGTLKIQLVDAYDYENYITVQIKPYHDMLNTSDVGYVLACASNGQTLTGKERGTSKIFFNEWGTWQYFRFFGKNDNGSRCYESLTLCYDSIEKQIYIYESATNMRYIVADFDDIQYFNSNLWKGFSTGKIFCKVFCEEYEMSSANLLITKYANSDLSNSKVKDTVEPIITVDFEDYSENNYPKAVVGKTYQLFNATAADDYSGDTDVNVSVYRNYYSTNPIPVVVNDRKLTFIPNVAGIYQVVYKSTDESGNVAEKILEVNANVADGDEAYNIVIGEYLNSVVAGELFTLPTIDTVNGSGKTVIDVVAINQGKNIPIINNTIRPIYSGKLFVTITATDYVNQTATKELEITVNVTDKPTFVETPTLPKYFIEGVRYNLPEVTAYNYTDGSGEKIETDILIKRVGEQAQSLGGNVYIPSVVSDRDVVEVIYQATLSGKTNSISQTVPVHKVKTDNKLDMSKYFYTTNLGSSVTSSGAGLTLTSSSNTEFEFINSIYSANTTLNLQATTDTKNISKITFKFTDFYNQNNAFTLTYIKGYMFVNGDENNKVALANDFSTNNKFKIVYNNNIQTVSYDVSSNNSIEINTNTLGQEFNGFESFEYYLSIIIETNQSSSIIFSEINGHTFSNDKFEFINPSVSFIGDSYGERSINSIYLLPTALVYDVMDGKVNGKLTVTDPSNNIVVAKNGVRLENVSTDIQGLEILMDKFGTYSFRYESKDNSENVMNYMFTVNVIDEEKPVITVDGSLSGTFKVGDNINLPAAKVTDNKTNSISCTIYVIMPNNKILNSGDANSLVLAMAGEYQIIYSAADEEGNYTVKVFTVFAK